MGTGASTTSPIDAILTKVGDAGAPGSSAGTGARVATHLLRQAVDRLEVVCAAVVGSVLLSWVGVNLARGTFAGELRDASQWAPPVGVLATSLAMLALARSGRLRPETVVRVGLVYEVAVSFGAAAGGMLGAFVDATPEQFEPDRVGLSPVGVWMMFFTVLVPARPREALLALLASASAVPSLYAAQAGAGAAPDLPAGRFFLLFVLPYLVVAALSYVAARVVHRLGVEVHRAHEMGSYKLDALLGRGGMGEVWRASHHTLARPAAIKLIRRDALGDDPAAAEVAAARFEREAQVIAHLRSPHTVQLYDFGRTEDGTLYYVMELLDGVDLEQLVRAHGPLPPERVVHVLRQVCASLREAHLRGVVHRDVKPANIYLCHEAFEHDVAKVLDFGLVKPAASPGGTALSLTRADTVAGTPAYMAPELALGASVDARADLYALGCVAFWLLTGRLVFQAATANAMIVSHVRDAPPRPSACSELRIPESLEELVLDCLAKDPAARPQTAGDVAGRLQTMRFDPPWTSERAARWWRAHRPAADAAS
jgi:serine/threonine-protein kinase